MGIRRREFYHRQQGALGNMEDWWYLAVDTTSERTFVVHEWCHTRLGSIRSETGEEEIDLAHFLGRSMSPERRALFQLIAGLAGA